MASTIRIGGVRIDVGLGLKQLDTGLKTMRESLNRASRDFDRLGQKLTRNISLPLATVGALSVKAFASFDSAMTKSLAIMGDVDAAMREKLVAGAKEVAKETTFSAKQAAESYFYLASAGLDATQSLEALPAVARFAQAGAFDLQRATDLLTDAQSALGLTIRDDAVANMQNMVEVSDVLVRANTLANASVEQFSEALTNKLGASLRSANIGIEEGVAALAVFADQGIKGADAGTQLRIVLRDLQSKSIENAAAFKKHGIAVWDSKENMRSLFEIVGDLEEHLKPMSAQLQVATLKQLGFADKSIAATKVLLGTSEAMRGYYEELKNAAGFTEGVALKQLESFSSQMKLIKNSLEVAGISIGEVLAPKVLEFARGVASLTAEFERLERPQQEIIVNFGLAAAAIGPVTIAVGALAASIAMILSPIGLAITATGLLAGAMIAVEADIGSMSDLTIPNLVKALDALMDKLRKVGELWGKFHGFASKTLPDWILSSGIALDIGGMGQLDQEIQNRMDQVVEDLSSDTLEKTKKALQGYNELTSILNSFGNEVWQDRYAQDISRLEGQVQDAAKNFGLLKKAAEEAGESGADSAGKIGEETEETSAKVEKFQQIISKFFGDLDGKTDKTTGKIRKNVQNIERDIINFKKEVEQIDLSKAIDDSIKNQDAGQFNALVKEFEKVSKEGILEGYKEAIEEGGAEAKKQAEELATLKTDREVEELRTRYKETMIESHRQAVQQWQTFFENAITGVRFDLEDMFESIAVGFAAELAAQLSEQSGFSGLDFSSPQALGSSIASLILSPSSAGGAAGQGGGGLSGIITSLFGNQGGEPGILLSDGSVIRAGDSIPSGLRAVGSAEYISGMNPYLAGAVGYGSALYTTGSAFSDRAEKDRASGSKEGTGEAIGAGLGMAVGAAFAGPLGAMVGSMIGSAIGGAIGGLIGNAPHPATVSRSEGWAQLNEKLPGGYGFVDAEGNSRHLDKLDLDEYLHMKDRDWASSAEEKFGTDNFLAAVGIGEALEEILGLTEDVGAHIGAALLNNVGGSVDALRMLLIKLGVSVEEVGAQLLELAKTGEISWHEYEVMLQKVNKAAGEGLQAVGDVQGAFDALAASGGRGVEAAISIQDIAVEALERGIKSLAELKEYLLSTGEYSEEEVNQLMEALSNRGIESLEDLKNASIEQLGGVVAELEALGFKWDEVNQKIENVTQAVEELDGKTVTVNIKANIDPKLEEVMSESGGGEAAPAAPEAPAQNNWRGGVLTRRALIRPGQWAGEAGPEALLPLRRMSGGKLGVMAAGVSNRSAMGAVINIDARGAAPGVEADILSALDDMEDRIVNNAISAVTDGLSRGYY